MEEIKMFKAMADETRYKILLMLLVIIIASGFGAKSGISGISRIPALKGLAGCRFNYRRKKKLLHAL